MIMTSSGQLAFKKKMKPGRLLEFSSDLGQSSKFILPGFEIIEKVKRNEKLSCEVN